MNPHKTKPITVNRRYPAAPLVGVGVVVFNDQGDVLLVKRGRPPRVGEWSLPGGLLDLGERLADAAQREVREECGIEITLGGFITTYEPIIYDAAGEIEYHYILLDYWATYHAGELTAQDDAAAVAWVALPSLTQFRLRSETLQVIHTAHTTWRTSHAS
ncbi:MAG: NUDIX hydrolase [Caldilineaceae bacterium]|nr:NUDIX hydrolase [Caldilineaceae bacterium]